MPASPRSIFIPIGLFWLNKGVCTLIHLGPLKVQIGHSRYHKYNKIVCNAVSLIHTSPSKQPVVPCVWLVLYVLTKVASLGALISNHHLINRQFTSGRNCQKHFCDGIEDGSDFEEVVHTPICLLLVIEVDDT